MPLRTHWETLVSAQGDGNAITAAARTSLLTGSAAHAVYALPPNYFDVIGKMLLVLATGRISSVITTPGTARYDVNFLDSAAANAIVFDGLATLLEDGEAHTNQHWILGVLLTCRAVGPTGNLMGQGFWMSTDIQNRFSMGANPVGGIVAMLPWNTAAAVGANFNTTLQQTVDLRFTQTVATGSVQLHQYWLISPN